MSSPQGRCWVSFYCVSLSELALHRVLKGWLNPWNGKTRSTGWLRGTEQILFFFLFFLMALQGFWDLSCQLEIEPRPSAVRLWGPNIQTTREVPEQLLKSFQCGSEVAAMSLAGPLLFRHWENSGCIKSELPRMFSCPLEFRGSMGLGLYKMK